MTETEASPACWNCGQAPENPHFCRRCGSLQPPATDYFSYLGRPRKLVIDRQELEKTFYELSRRLHPDRFFRRPERERRLSEDATARLNDAYRTLKDPVARAEYLLGLYGLHKRSGQGPKAPPELLEEVFELNMALEETRAGDESARPGLEAARKKFEGLEEELHRSLEAAFAEWDATQQRAALDKIAAALDRRNYIRNLLRDVNAALAAHG